MDNKIDGIFEYKSYRYIPNDLRKEWKTLYNIYGRDFYKNMHKGNYLFPQIRIDFYNEELQRLNMLENLCNKFEPKVLNLKSKYEHEKEYSEDIKKSIIISLNQIKKFIEINKKIINNKINKNKIPQKNIIEHYNDKCYDLDYISNKKFTIIIPLFIIILIFYLTFNRK